MAHHDMTYDSRRGALILAGRPEWSDVKVYRSTTDGEWHLLPSPTPMPQGGDVEISYDPDRDVTVLYTNDGNKVWELTGETWTMKEPATTPIQCMDGALLQYDPIRRKTVLVGCGEWPGPDVPSETWLWDGADWSLAAGVDSSPVGAAGGGMVFDVSRGEMVLITHSTMQTWVFDGAAWTQRHPATVPDPGVWVIDLAFDPVAERAVFFGGETLGSTPEAEATYPEKTWAWDGQDWTELGLLSPPPANIDYAFAFFPERSALVMHGGWSEASEWRMRNNVWLLELGGAPAAEIRFTNIEALGGGEFKLTSTGRSASGNRQILQGTAQLGPQADWVSLQTNDNPQDENVWTVASQEPTRLFRILEE
jgi:hypothetical protein